MKKLKLFSLSILMMSFSFQAYSWGLTGHRIVAKIADNHLNEDTRLALKSIFGEEKLEYWANWPDFIKSDTTGKWTHTFQWHYVNIDSGKDYNEFLEALNEMTVPNIHNQIKALSEKVKDPATSLEEKKTAIVFLIHLVGDMHQPLHVGRYQDLGGNRINLSYFGKEVNLHSLWDDHLVDFQKYSYSEYARILDIKTKSEVNQIQSGTLEDWLYDSYEAVEEIYAKTRANSMLSYDYNYQFTHLMERQLLNGGLRLAKVLNDILS